MFSRSTTFILSMMFAIFWIDSKAALSGSDTMSDAERKEIIEAAVKNPDSPTALANYLATLEKDGDHHYFIEGDLRLTKVEIVEYLDGLKDPDTRPRSEELIVAHDPTTGEMSYWKDKASRRISFTIDYESFEGYGGQSTAETVLDDLMAAAHWWENACRECGIDFVFVDPKDAGASFKDVIFVLQYRHLISSKIARAFFPYQYLSKMKPQKVEVFPKYFTSSFNRVGVLRHELGHVLGYRHEHISNIHGCKSEGGKTTAITPYDSKSAMHYLCGGSGSKELKLSSEDIKGHKCLYLKGGVKCSQK